MLSIEGDQRLSSLKSEITCSTEDNDDGDSQLNPSVNDGKGSCGQKASKVWSKATRFEESKRLQDTEKEKKSNASVIKSNEQLESLESCL